MGDDVGAEIPVRLRYWRNVTRLSQTQLANALQVSKATVSDWESGRCKPRMGMLERVVSVFGTELGLPFTVATFFAAPTTEPPKPCDQ